MASVSVFTVFIEWLIISPRYSVILWCRIHGSWVLGSRDILLVIVSISCCIGVSCGAFQGSLAEPSGVTVCGLRTCACCSCCAGYMRWKSLTRWWLSWALLGWLSSMYHEGICETASVRSYWLSDECLICLLAGIFDCFTVRSLIMAPKEYNHCWGTFSEGAGHMALVFNQGSLLNLLTGWVVLALV